MLPVGAIHGRGLRSRIADRRPEKGRASAIEIAAASTTCPRLVDIPIARVVVAASACAHPSTRARILHLHVEEHIRARKEDARINLIQRADGGERHVRSGAADVAGREGPARNLSIECCLSEGLVAAGPLSGRQLVRLQDVGDDVDSPAPG
jgi:hypothetical protein